MIEDYRKARKRGAKQVKKAMAAGRYPFPAALDDILQGQPLSRETSLGIREIPVALVVGTRVRGRQNLFSEGFMPLADEGTEFAAKWSRLYDAQISEGFREPIVVREFLQRFYVQEGNKRVSVARYVGMPTILAQVTRVVPMWGAGLDDELARYEAFERFYRVAPLYDLAFSHAEDYERLSQSLGRSLESAWADDEVRHLKAAFSTFCGAYARRGGDRLECSASDAFLIYVQAYARKDPLCATPAVMAERVKQLWDEFVVASQPVPIAFVAEPQEQPTGIVSKVVGKVHPDRKSVGVAFVYDRDATTSGWIRLHDKARQELARRTGGAIEAYAYADCGTDERFEAAVASAVELGCAAVVTVSPRQLAQTRRCATAYPHTLFFNCAINQSASAVRTFCARMYEVKFLMGALAASLSQTHQLGYVAHAPMDGTVAEVNAFALGAALVDPYATVHLSWLAATPHVHEEFARVGVDVIADKDYPTPAAPDEPYGLYAVHDGGLQRVATPVWDWGRYYELMLRALCAGGSRVEPKELKRHAINYWWGMRTGVVRLDLQEGVALGQKRLVDMLETAMMEGRLAPFDTMLVDQEGNAVRDVGDPQLSDAQIASMRWLGSNVVGSLPQLGELTPGGQADVRAVGISELQVGGPCAGGPQVDEPRPSGQQPSDLRPGALQAGDSRSGDPRPSNPQVSNPPPGDLRPSGE